MWPSGRQPGNKNLTRGPGDDVVTANVEKQLTEKQQEMLDECSTAVRNVKCPPPAVVYVLSVLCSMQGYSKCEETGPDMYTSRATVLV